MTEEEFKILMGTCPKNPPTNNWLRMHHKPMIGKKKRQEIKRTIIKWYRINEKDICDYLYSKLYERFPYNYNEFVDFPKIL